MYNKYKVYTCEEPITNTIIIYIVSKVVNKGISRRHSLDEFHKRPDFYIEETTFKIPKTIKETKI